MLSYMNRRSDKEDELQQNQSNGSQAMKWHNIKPVSFNYLEKLKTYGKKFLSINCAFYSSKQLLFQMFASPMSIQRVTLEMCSECYTIYLYTGKTSDSKILILLLPDKIYTNKSTVKYYTISSGAFVNIKHDCQNTWRMITDMLYMEIYSLAVKNSVA